MKSDEKGVVSERPSEKLLAFFVSIDKNPTGSRL